MFNALWQHSLNHAHWERVHRIRLHRIHMASTADLAGYPPTVWYFSKITDTDHAGYVWILALLTLLYPLGSCFVRFNVRYGLYMNDDWVLGGATVRQAWCSCSSN